MSDPLFHGLISNLDLGGPSGYSQLVLNFHNPMVRRLAALADPERLGLAARILYLQGVMLAHQPLSTRELSLLQETTSQLLGLSLEPSR